ncbi:MAG TPA: hypothetical protein VMU28_11695, partial [Terriglobales bacterium]|nr:hypothetical protein [Terriglobales bacterium]
SMNAIAGTTWSKLCNGSGSRKSDLRLTVRGRGRPRYKNLSFCLVRLGFHRHPIFQSSVVAY